MTDSDLQQLIDQKTDGIFGLVAAFTNARSTVGEKYLKVFLEKVPEKGEALWVRFRTFQEEQRNSNFEPSFDHFIASIIASDLIITSDL